MTPIVFALLAYFGWGFGDNLSVVISRRMNAISVTFWGFIFRFAGYTVMIPFFLHDLRHITLPIFFINIFVGIATATGYVLFFKAAQKTNPAIVGAIAGSWSAPAFILSLIFLHESINLVQAIAISVIFFGIFLTAFKFQEIRKLSFVGDTGILLAITVMILWGICGSFLKIPIVQIGWFWSTYFLVIPFTLVLFVMQIVHKEHLQKPTHNKMFLPLLLYALLTAVAESSYNIGISRGLIAIVAPIAGSYATFFVILAALLFREPMTRQQAFGIILAVGGIVCLSFTAV